MRLRTKQLSFLLMIMFLYKDILWEAELRHPRQLGLETFLFPSHSMTEDILWLTPSYTCGVGSYHLPTYLSISILPLFALEMPFSSLSTSSSLFSGKPFCLRLKPSSTTLERGVSYLKYYQVQSHFQSEQLHKSHGTKRIFTTFINFSLNR